MTLEELAVWHDEWADKLTEVAGTIASDMRVAARHRATAAALRELITRRGPRYSAVETNDATVATDAALKECE